MVSGCIMYFMDMHKCVMLLICAATSLLSVLVYVCVTYVCVCGVGGGECVCVWEGRG